MIRRALSLADIGFEVSVEGPCDPDHVDARFAGYYVLPERLGDDRVTLSVRVDQGWVRPEGITVPFPGVEVSRDPRGHLLFRRSSEVTDYDPAARAAVTRARPSPVRLPPVEDPTPLEAPLRMLLAHELPRRGGMLVHASGWRDPRGAVIFLAVSGGGKTTTARKLPHEGVLSDDQVALRFDPGGITAHALPFVGEYRRATLPGSGALRAVVLLAQGETAKSERVSTAAALAGIGRCVVSFERGDPTTAATLERVAALATTVPVYRWTLTREGPVRAMIDEVLG